MGPEPIGASTLMRLAKLQTGGCPVLSVHLDLDRDQRDRAGGDAQPEALLGRVGQDEAKLDVARVQDPVRRSPPQPKRRSPIRAPRA